MTEGVCFVCAQRTELVPGHHICHGCHDPRKCRRGDCSVRRASQPKKSVKTSFYKDACFAALTELGGRATTAQLVEMTGYSGNQVSSSMRSANGVRYEIDPTSNKRSGGHWCLETDADGESTAPKTSPRLAA